MKKCFRVILGRGLSNSQGQSFTRVNLKKGIALLFLWLIFPISLFSFEFKSIKLPQKIYIKNDPAQNFSLNCQIAFQIEKKDELFFENVLREVNYSGFTVYFEYIIFAKILFFNRDNQCIKVYSGMGDCFMGSDHISESLGIDGAPNKKVSNLQKKEKFIFLPSSITQGYVRTVHTTFISPSTLKYQLEIDEVLNKKALEYLLVKIDRIEIYWHFNFDTRIGEKERKRSGMLELIINKEKEIGIKYE